MSNFDCCVFQQGIIKVQAATQRVSDSSASASNQDEPALFNMKDRVDFETFACIYKHLAYVHALFSGEFNISSALLSL